MDVTVSLPDELRKWATKQLKKGELSRMLRDALIEERRRREIMETTLAEAQVHEVYVEDAEGRGFVGRITGALVAGDEDAEVEVFLTKDKRVIAYNGRESKYWEVDNPEEELRPLLSNAWYAIACEALGIRPIIDL